MSLPKTDDDSREPISLFELERRTRHLDPSRAVTDDAIPKLPSSSPWAASIDEIVGAEPPINREVDGTINLEEDQ
jgi:hypothetical protein